MVTPDEDTVLRVDGRRPLSAESVAALTAACDSAEDRGAHSPLVIRVSGTPLGSWTAGLNVALVSKWERGLRRLERLRATSVVIAAGDCGGTALDVLLAADYRIADTATRLIVPVEGGATWPGMALYRLTSQAGAGAIRAAVLFGQPIGAAAALDLHLIDKVSDDTAAALTASLALIGTLSGPEVSIRRQLMLEAATVGFEESLGAHLAACDRALRRVSAEAAS